MTTGLVILLAVHLAATAAMTGLIWFVQVVHYPLFDLVGRAQFVGYEAAHRGSRRGSSARSWRSRESAPS